MSEESASPRVLLVDDEEEFLDSMGRLLRTRGMEVHTAGDGHRAMTELRAHEVDVVVLDVRMPGIDGLELLREVRREFSDCEVIVLTGDPHAEDTMQGLRLGARVRLLGALECLSKPPDIGRLVGLIRSAAARRRARSSATSATRATE